MLNCVMLMLRLQLCSLAGHTHFHSPWKWVWSARLPAVGVGYVLKLHPLTMYRAVPPPEQPGALASGPGKEGPPNPGAAPPKPANISTQQWKRFQDLRSRREEECGRAAEHRIAAVQSRALKAVKEELSELDRSILREEGLSLPRGKQLRRKRRRGHGNQPAHPPDEIQTESLHEEARWQEVRRYLDPNPHLSTDKEAPKSKLEEEMDTAIEGREFEKAVSMSDKMAQREFATKVATAFDCQKYVKKRKIMEERKKVKKDKLRQSSSKPQLLPPS